MRQSLSTVGLSEYRSINCYQGSITKRLLDLFQTSHEDFNISKTSSYLDLSPLYGDVQADQDQIRTFKDGKLKADCFAEERLLGFPPGTGCMLIMYNRSVQNRVPDTEKNAEGSQIS